MQVTQTHRNPSASHVGGRRSTTIIPELISQFHFTIMWKPIVTPPGFSDWEISERGEIRRICDKTPIIPHMHSTGYPAVSRVLSDGTGKRRQVILLIHRVVAEHYVQHIPDGYVVHHVDGDKCNPYYKNLVVCTVDEHRKYHADTDADNHSVRYRGFPLMSEKTVHAVCKLLEDGTPFPKIRRKLGLSNMTDDAIGKIAQGRNWKQISSQYKIPKVTRSCMNSFSDYALPIAILQNRGLSVREIARCISFEIKTKTDYNRLSKCSIRYRKQLCEGKWGLLTTKRANEILKDYGIEY